MRFESDARRTRAENLIPISTCSSSDQKNYPLLLGDLREALSESDLPFSVDIVEAQYAEPEFLASLEELGTVELGLLSDTT